MTEQDSQLIEPDPDFKPLPFRLTVHAIWKGNLPAVDEELAKRVGLQSVEELHQKINERLEQEVQEEAFTTQIQAIERLLVEKYPIDLPQSYIDANKEARLNDYLRQLEEQKREYSNSDYKQIEKSIEQSTIFNLQLFFLLRKIATEHNIEVSNEDVSQELTRQLTLMSSGRNNINFSQQEKLQEQLYNLAFERKIKQFLVEQAIDKE